ncbi:MAG: hypothetical protein AAF394_13040 [Planctomycetota bacterium]
MYETLSDSDLVAAKNSLARDFPEHAIEILDLPDEFPGYASAAIRLIIADAKRIRNRFPAARKPELRAAEHSPA